MLWGGAGKGSKEWTPLEPRCEGPSQLVHWKHFPAMNARYSATLQMCLYKRKLQAQFLAATDRWDPLDSHQVLRNPLRHQLPFPWPIRKYWGLRIIELFTDFLSVLSLTFSLLPRPQGARFRYGHISWCLERLFAKVLQRRFSAYDDVSHWVYVSCRPFRSVWVERWLSPADF